MRRNLMPSIEEESPASAREVPIEPATERMEDDDSAKGRRCSTDQIPLINKVLCIEEIQKNDLASLRLRICLDYNFEAIGKTYLQMGADSFGFTADFLEEALNKAIKSWTLHLLRLLSLPQLAAQLSLISCRKADWDCSA